MGCKYKTPDTFVPFWYLSYTRKYVHGRKTGLCKRFKQPIRRSFQYVRFTLVSIVEARRVHKNDVSIAPLLHRREDSELFELFGTGTKPIANLYVCARCGFYKLIGDEQEILGQTAHEALTLLFPAPVGPITLEMQTISPVGPDQFHQKTYATIFGTRGLPDEVLLLPP